MKLPAPAPGFHWTSETWGHGLRADALAARVQHVFTTGQLALRGGPAARPAEWAAAAASVGAGLHELRRVRQVHGRAIRVLARGTAQPSDMDAVPDADAIVSDVPGLALAVQVADCVPVLLADTRTGVSAAVHAGWRGTSAAIVRAVVETMQATFGCRPDDIVAAIGPSIGPCCYEVGADVYEAFRAAGHAGAELAAWFATVPGPGGPALRLDLPRANRDLLHGAGVSLADIACVGLCTRTHRDVFDSFRADGDAAGRMAAIVAVPVVEG